MGGLLAGSVDEGPVHITAPAAAVTLSYGPVGLDAGSEYFAGASTQFFKGGDTITITGGGSVDVAPFSESVIAPNDIVLTAPDCSGFNTCVEVDRTTDLAVAWTGGGAGKVVARFAAASDTRDVNIFCSFDAAGGKGVVPSPILLKLGSGANAIYVPQNEVHFTVDAIETTFFVMGTGAEGAFNVSR